jgi:hypothetical protein
LLFQIEIVLKTQPELGRVAEVFREAEGGVRSDASITCDDPAWQDSSCDTGFWGMPMSFARR